MRRESAATGMRQRGTHAGCEPASNDWWNGRAEVPSAPVASLYVHIPFCATKCPYCDFNSHAGRESEIPSYAEALEFELRRWAPNLACDTIFVGGGTPTHGTSDQLRLYLDAMCKHIPLVDDYEWTIEINPGSLTREKALDLRRAGVNRVSIGAQSFSAKHLKTLGRGHSVQDTAEAMAICREAGFESLSLDLILAIPDQTLREQREDLEAALSLGPDHVSTYVLTYEPGTRFTQWAQEGRLPGPNSDRELAHLTLACHELGREGFVRYEISNFARDGAVCRHNLAYWRMENWIGVGAGAHSHIGGRRWKLVDDPASYAQPIVNGELPLAFEEQSTASQRLVERFMMGLRLEEGVDLRRATHELGDAVVARSQAARLRLESFGMLTMHDAQLRATPKGLDVLNEVVLQLIADIN